MDAEKMMTGVRNVDEILARIFGARGFDIHNFKMSDLQRKVSRRMDVLEVASLSDYLKHIEANPEEHKALFDTILVNTSKFFRDMDAWNFVRESILPEILERGDEVRIWSAGCASGEEAYSVAIVLAEMLGDDLSKRAVRIYATDIDEAALKFARNGTYTLDQMNGIPEDLRQKYFTCHGDACTINTEIRRLLIFSQNNLVSEPPMSRIDLLLCRNVLIYLNHALQSEVIPKLQYALNDTGYLWLGEVEMLLTSAHRFRISNPKHRIFRRVPFPTHTQFDTMVPAGRYTKANLMETNREFEEIIQNLKIGFILLDKELNIKMCNRAIQKIFGILPEQIRGKPFLDLEISHCSIDLRHRTENALTTGEPSVVEGIERWNAENEKISLKMEIIPVASGVIIFLEDITRQYELEEELQTMNMALDTVHKKFLSTNEELSTANRQFQAINTVLQSMNEELESTNEELKATNEELYARAAELNSLNRYNTMMLNSIDSGIIVTDDKLTVKTWNDAAAQMWGKKDDEVAGKPLMSLKIGIPLQQIADQLEDVIKTGEHAVKTLQYMNHQGEKTAIDISIKPLMGKKPEGLVLIITEHRAR